MVQRNEWRWTRLHLTAHLQAPTRMGLEDLEMKRPPLTTPKIVLLRTLSKDTPMLTFEIIGGIFVLLFLAAAMTGIEGAEGR